MGSQMIQIIILAAIALFLILRLRSVLGTREGFEKPQESTTPLPPRRSERPFEVIEGGTTDPDISDVADPVSPTGQALAEMKRVDRNFSVSDFAHGARAAYEMIVMAYENGDLETLRRFLAPEVYDSFAAAIEARTAKGYTVEASFAGIREVKLLEAEYDPVTHEADVTMRFTGELTSVVRDPQGRIVEGAPGELKQQRDVWTFSRDMTSENPNWQLSGTGG
jgi:predicted lipid-binding transport protein (Tim44 family)